MLWSSGKSFFPAAQQLLKLRPSRDFPEWQFRTAPYLLPQQRRQLLFLELRSLSLIASLRFIRPLSFKSNTFLALLLWDFSLFFHAFTLSEKSPLLLHTMSSSDQDSSKKPQSSARPAASKASSAWGWPHLRGKTSVAVSLNSAQKDRDSSSTKDSVPPADVKPPVRRQSAPQRAPTKILDEAEEDQGQPEPHSAPAEDEVESSAEDLAQEDLPHLSQDYDKQPEEEDDKQPEEEDGGQIEEDAEVAIGEDDGKTPMPVKGRTQTSLSEAETLQNPDTDEQLDKKGLKISAGEDSDEKPLEMSADESSKAPLQSKSRRPTQKSLSDSNTTSVPDKNVPGPPSRKSTAPITKVPTLGRKASTPSREDSTPSRKSSGSTAKGSVSFDETPVPQKNASISEDGKASVTRASTAKSKSEVNKPQAPIPGAFEADSDAEEPVASGTSTEKSMSDAEPVEASVSETASISSSEEKPAPARTATNKSRPEAGINDGMPVKKRTSTSKSMPESGIDDEKPVAKRTGTNKSRPEAITGDWKPGTKRTGTNKSEPEASIDDEVPTVRRASTTKSKPKADVAPVSEDLNADAEVEKPSMTRASTRPKASVSESSSSSTEDEKPAVTRASTQKSRPKFDTADLEDKKPTVRRASTKKPKPETSNAAAADAELDAAANVDEKPTVRRASTKKSKPETNTAGAADAEVATETPVSKSSSAATASSPKINIIRASEDRGKAIDGIKGVDTKDFEEKPKSAPPTPATSHPGMLPSSTNLTSPVGEPSKDAIPAKEVGAHLDPNQTLVSPTLQNNVKEAAEDPQTLADAKAARRKVPKHRRLRAKVVRGPILRGAVGRDLALQVGPALKLAGEGMPPGHATLSIKSNHSAAASAKVKVRGKDGASSEGSFGA